MKRMAGLFGLLLVSTVGAVTYEDEFTDKKGSAYHEDINVWVYTKAFSERFGMPDKWVDEGLKGAYAVAFRVETASGGLLLPHKGPSARIPIRRCLLDVYLSSDAKLPWVDEREVGIRYKSPASPKYLIPQSESDIYYRSLAMGIAHPGSNARKPLVYLGENEVGGRTIGLVQYNKLLYPGIVFTSFSIGCWTPPNKAAWVEFRKDQEWTGYNYKVLHKVVLPESFMKRLYRDWDRENRDPSAREFGDVLKE